jgi:thioesterase domain-containing protein
MLFQAPTIEQMAEALRRGGWKEPWLSLVPLQPKGNRTPFFCIGISTELASLLGDDQPVYGVIPHGQDGRRAPVTVEAMAADYIREIRTLQPDGPYLLGGYSFGGLVAYEIAQQMSRAGQKVTLLALLDPIYPDSEDSSPQGRSGVTRTWERLGKLSAVISQSFSNLFRQQKTTGEVTLRERVEWRLIRLRRKLRIGVCQLFLGMGRKVPSSLRMLYFEEVSSQATQLYNPRVYQGRIFLLRSEESEWDLETTWGQLAGEGLETQLLPGKHLDIMREPDVRLWSEPLSSWLKRVRNGKPAKTLSP